MKLLSETATTFCNKLDNKHSNSETFLEIEFSREYDILRKQGSFFDLSNSVLIQSMPTGKNFWNFVINDPILEFIFLIVVNSQLQCRLDAALSNCLINCHFHPTFTTLPSTTWFHILNSNFFWSSAYVRNKKVCFDMVHLIQFNTPSNLHDPVAVELIKS